MTRADIWALACITLVGWEFHPGNLKSERELDFELIGRVCDEVLAEFDRRFPAWP